LKHLKGWIAILAMLALVLTTLFTGILAAAPEGDQPAAEEQSVEKPADTAAEALESEEQAGDETAEEEPALDLELDEEPVIDEDPDTEAEDPVEVEEPAIIEGEADEDRSELPDGETQETEETEIEVDVPEEKESGVNEEAAVELEPQLPRDAEALCHPRGKICVVKFADKNCNGRKDCGEKGLKGVEITIQKGRFTRTKTTSHSGKVCFYNLELGTYTVSEGGKDGYYATTPTSEQVTLTRCNKKQTVYFGNAPYLSICGYKFLDKDKDGRWDFGEPTMKDVTICLTLGDNINHADGEIGANNGTCVKTDWKGKYCFDGLKPGTYTVSEIVPEGYRQTYPEGGVHVVTLRCGKDAGCINFGNAPAGGSICGTKFKDKDCDGEWDCGESWKYPKVTILLQGEGIELSTKTDWKGRYCFDGLKPGNYTVSEQVPDGYFQTYPEGGTHEVTLECGEDIKGIDFGNAPCGKIWGIKWEDKDCSGGWSCGDRGMGGVEMQLWHDGQRIETTTTSSCFLLRGTYRFETCLEPGIYTVKEVAPEGYHPSYPYGGEYTVELGCGQCKMLCFFNAPNGSICGYKFWDQNCSGEWDDGEPPIEGVTICLETGANDLQPTNENGNDNGMCTQTDETGKYCFDNLPPGYYQVHETPPEGFYPTTPNPVPVELGCGEDVTGILFGNAPYSRIDGLKLEDTDGDGEGDEGLDGVTIELYQDDTLIDTTVTHDGGAFEFTGLKAGTYLVMEIVPEGFYAIGDTEIKVAVCGEEGEPITFVNAREGKISGTKYLDADGDGILDPGEEVMVMGGVTINLTEKGKTGALASTQSKGNGTFSFEGLKADDYIVTEALPAGYYQTGNTEWNIFVGPGDDIPVYFLNAPFASISGTKWNDANGNRKADDGETGMGGVTITLNGTTLGGTPVAIVTTTFTDGTYYFNKLEAGTYTVTETVPGGMKATSDASKTVTLVPGQDKIVDFHNQAKTRGIIIGPEVEGQLPYTGMNQLALMLAGAGLMLLGLMALALGILRLRGSRA